MTEWIITSSLLISVVLVVRLLSRQRISSRLQYGLWGLVLLRLLMPFSLLESPVSVMNVVDLSPAEYGADYRNAANGLYQETIVEEYTASSGMTNNEINNSGSGVAADYKLPISVADILKRIWWIGSFVMGAWWIGTNIRFFMGLRRTRKAYPDLDCKLPVYITDQIASPCLFGVFRPSIYLTSKAAANEISIRHVLLHELCHYRHLDHIWSIIRGICLVIWWWNPLVWAAAIYSREDAELACDEAVIKQVGADSRFAYGRTLLDMITIKQSAAALISVSTTMNSGQRSMKKRLNMIINRPQTFTSAMVTVLLIAVISAGCTFTGASPAVPAEQDLSMLDINNLASVAHQSEELLVSRAPGRNLSFYIAAGAVAEYLDNVDWQEQQLDSPPETGRAADLVIEWNEHQELQFYGTEPFLAMVRMNQQWRSFSIGEHDYEQAIALIEQAPVLADTAVGGEYEDVNISVYLTDSARGQPELATVRYQDWELELLVPLLALTGSVSVDVQQAGRIYSFQYGYYARDEQQNRLPRSNVYLFYLETTDNRHYIKKVDWDNRFNMDTFDEEVKRELLNILGTDNWVELNQSPVLATQTQADSEPLFSLPE